MMITAGKFTGLEISQTLTISIKHIHQKTIEALEICKGYLPGSMPSLAVRNEGYFLHAGVRDVMPDGTDFEIESDFAPQLGGPSFAELYPDLVAIRALARRAGAEWICIDVDGPEISQLPIYDEDEELPLLPADAAWANIYEGALKSHGQGQIFAMTKEMASRILNI